MAAVSFDEKILAAKSIICDVEGTTSSISFVKDTLFPYALKNVEEYLKTNWNEDATKTVVAALREQADEDKKAELEGVVPIPAEDSEDIIPDIVKNVEWQMSLDRKTGSLKTLQGLVWAKGYKDGSIKGHVYDDVQSAFEKWTESGRKIYIYSSGSVDAQKLLFEHSEKGDLVKYLTGHYDTKIGAKQEKDSYDAILKNIEATAEEVLFLTDVVAEAKAAKEAGLNVVVLDRPGNAELSEDDRKEYTVISSFADIPFESIESANGAAAKRKIDEAQEEDEAQPPTKVVKVNENGDKAAVPVVEEPAKTNGDAKVEEKAPAAAEGMEVDDAAQDAEKAKTTEPEVTNKTDDNKEAEQESPKEPEVSKTDDEKKKKEEEVVEEKEPKKSEDDAAKVEESSSSTTETVAVPAKEEEKMEVDGEAVAAAPAENKEAEKKEDKPAEKVAEESVADVTSTEPAKEEEKPVEPVVESTTEAEPAKPSAEAEKVEEKKPAEEAKEAPVETMETDSTTTKEPEAEPKKEEEAKTEEVKPAEAEAKPAETVTKAAAESAEEVKPAEETKGEEATTAGPVDEVAVEAKAAEKEETKKADSEEVSTTTTSTETKENGTHQNGVSEAAPVNGKEEARVPENGEAEPAATNGGSNGNAHSDEKGDSDKENDTAKTNVEEGAAASGTENGSSTTTTTTPAADAATEIKATKKVIDSSTTPTPPIEAES